MVAEDVRLLEGMLNSMSVDLRAIRADLHAFTESANRVHSEHGVLIADLQARMKTVEKSVDESSNDRRRIWERVWQLGVTGAVIAQIVAGSRWDSVVK